MAKKSKDNPEKKDERYLNPPEKISNKFYGLYLDEEQYNFANSIWDPDNDIVFVNAGSGCGKSTIAVGMANLLVKYGFFKEIIYIMSPYGEQAQGWLPGTIEEKSNVYFEPFFQSMKQCNINPNVALKSSAEAQKNKTGYITCITDTFLRGQNLNNAVIILDEAQNYTASQLKKTLTRVGKNAKVIVIGHDKQCDLPFGKRSGFIQYLEHFRGHERAEICNLTVNHRGWISQHADALVE